MGTVILCTGGADQLCNHPYLLEINYDMASLILVKHSV